MTNRKRTSNPQPLTAIQELLAFVQEHRDAPLDQADEERLFALDTDVGAHFAKQHVNVPQFSSGNRTPGTKLNYERESAYKYSGALTGEPQIPAGETEHYGVCLHPHEDWLLWLRAIANKLPALKTEQRIPQRANRAANIEALEDALIEHLKAARDHAHEARTVDGVPKLLPRPTQAWLAKRLGIDKSTVHRCLDDPKARELALLWKTALDVDAIMSFNTPPGRRTGQ